MLSSLRDVRRATKYHQLGGAPAPVGSPRLAVPAPVEHVEPLHRPAASRATSDRQWWILAILGVSQLMLVLDGTIVNIALPAAQHTLHFSNADRQWVVTAYSLAFGSLLLIGGRIADSLGLRRTLMIGLVGFAAASGIGGLAKSFTVLIIGRGAQGAFAALLAPSVLALLTTTFRDSSDRGKAFAIYGGIAGGGGALGLLLGGVLTTYATWRWTLFVNIGVGIVALAGAGLLLKHDQATTHRHLDLSGAVLAVAGLFLLVFGFSHAETTSWGNRYTIGSLVVGSAFLFLFIVVESRALDPLLPLGIVRDRSRGASYLMIFIASMGVFGVFLFLTYYLQGVLSYSPIKTGMAYLPLIGSLVLFGGLASMKSVLNLGLRILEPVGMAAASLGAFLFTRITVSGDYRTEVLPAMVLMGIGLGIVFAPAFNAGTQRVATGVAGEASAVVNASQQVGGSIGAALLSTIAASAATSYAVARPLNALTVAHATVHGFTTAFWWVSGLFLLGALVSSLLYPSRVKQL